MNTDLRTSDEYRLQSAEFLLQSNDEGCHSKTGFVHTTECLPRLAPVVGGPKKAVGHVDDDGRGLEEVLLPTTAGLRRFTDGLRRLAPAGRRTTADLFRSARVLVTSTEELLQSTKAGFMSTEALFTSTEELLRVAAERADPPLYPSYL